MPSIFSFSIKSTENQQLSRYERFKKRQLSSRTPNPTPSVTEEGRVGDVVCALDSAASDINSEPLTSGNLMISKGTSCSILHEDKGTSCSVLHEDKSVGTQDDMDNPIQSIIEKLKEQNRSLTQHLHVIGSPAAMMEKNDEQTLF